jgi:hypothetical protein
VSDVPEGYKPPKGRKQHSLSAFEVNPPSDYKRAPRAKRDEYSAKREPVRVGRPKICQCCYRSGGGIIDHICNRCMKDRHELAKLEQEIAKVYPATARMTSAQIFRRLWEQNQKLKAQAKALRQHSLRMAKIQRNL